MSVGIWVVLTFNGLGHRAFALEKWFERWFAAIPVNHRLVKRLDASPSKFSTPFSEILQ